MHKKFIILPFHYFLFSSSASYSHYDFLSLSFDKYIEHHERYYLYLIISVTVGVLLCLIIITGRIIIQKQRDEVEDHSKDEPKFHKSSTGETTITKGFSGDNISEVEGGDIDLTTPIAISNLPTKCEVSCTLFCSLFFGAMKHISVNANIFDTFLSRIFFSFLLSNLFYINTLTNLFYFIQHRNHHSIRIHHL